MNTKTRILRSLLMTLFALTLSARAAEKIRIVTSYTDLAEFARAIGGYQVQVQSLCTGIEDTHGVPMRPSFLPLLHRADMLILMGLENEHAYVPALLDVSKNAKIMKGADGYVDCSVNIAPLEVPRTLDRAEGDEQPGANPHYNMDPVLVRTILQNILGAMVNCEPAHKAEFEKNCNAYQAKLDAKMVEWQQLAQTLKGVKFISYHHHWPYFANRFGLQYAGTIEIKAGIDATPRHVNELIAMMRKENVRIVVREPFFPEKLPREVASRTDAELIKLPIMVGGVPEATSYMAMMDYILHSFVNAVEKTRTRVSR